jgi:hypothetical protein
MHVMHPQRKTNKTIPSLLILKSNIIQNVANNNPISQHEYLLIMIGAF